jgi:tetratricopeptide (TPR) repeat protein
MSRDETPGGHGSDAGPRENPAPAGVSSSTDEAVGAPAEDLEELFYEGSDLHGEGRYAEAMERFERCLAVDPNYGDALLGKAMVHLERGEYDEAIALGHRIAELSPDDVLSFTSLSMFYERAGRIKEAEEAGARARMLDWRRRLGEESEG